MIDVSSLKAGDELEPFSRTTDFHVWNRYAAVNDEYVPIHMDDEAGRAAGLPGAIGMGNLQWAYLHNVVRQWLGDQGRIVKMSCQFRNPNLRNQTVSACGRVTRIEPGPDGVEVDLEVWTQDQDGHKLAPGACTVHLDR
ncbi:MAG: MaoC/PaaZ C-terminal domain-containing protein [Actinomycetota bacterium]|nr:MaoC/PaaZ C-terminal domain-containing protein [Actinomycetota bacterium]